MLYTAATFPNPFSEPERCMFSTRCVIIYFFSPFSSLFSSGFAHNTFYFTHITFYFVHITIYVLAKHTPGSAIQKNYSPLKNKQNLNWHSSKFVMNVHILVLTESCIIFRYLHIKIKINIYINKSLYIYYIYRCF